MTANPYSEGDWVQWTTPDQIKQGQVVTSLGPSIEVEWLGGGRHVFPTVEGYHPPYGGGAHRIEIIPRPRDASRIQRDERQGRMSVARAASLLGVERKRVRAMLRAGKLKGHQTDGRWTQVDSASVMELVHG